MKLLKLNYINSGLVSTRYFTEFTVLYKCGNGNFLMYYRVRIDRLTVGEYE